ncbi:MAG: hypothetical protein P3W97_003175 [Tepidimonas sp.]|uniref:hypothetical protein n=1 Tax=Tepidimonas sp. TaxID=2002775 RepID=UPI00259E29AE|nr:hypothetical protein [Tepidimonas sp.]MDM7456273.1 hypothetical protein [Tepidimonas sp.]
MASILDSSPHRLPPHRSALRGWSWMALVTAALAGCATPPPPAVETAVPPASSDPPAVAEPAAPQPDPPPPFTGKRSLAANERDYRRDGAQHLYEQYSDRVFRGKLPPLIQAVGVMRLDIGPQGELRRFEWMRAPDHVPHVKAEIERLVRAAAPFPAPQRLGSVVYTDTWLWDKSGTFQLDTLTEGQLDRMPASPARASLAPARPAAPTPKSRRSPTAATPSAKLAR